ncbi:MAG: uroporphyrinogen-III synthase [Chloroflexota bacterium]
MIADFDYEIPATPTKDKGSPLNGKHIVITRATHQADELGKLLRARGAEPLIYPCIAIVPPEDTSALDSAVRAATDGKFEWLMLTSTNTIHSLAERLASLGLENSALENLKVAAVGTATAEAARTILGVRVSVLPEEFRAEALAQAIDFTPGTPILLPQADVATSELAQSLAERGARVHTVIAYRTVVGTGGINLPAELAQNCIDVITFASPSAVCNLIWRLVEEGGSTQDLAGVTLACIGPATLKKARECGLSVAVTASVSTLEYLVSSLEEYFNDSASPSMVD